MRGELNFNMLPIVQENINDIAYNPTIHHHHGLTNNTISLPSNGYYGYQPPLDNKNKVDETMQVDNELFVNNRNRIVVNNRKRAFDGYNNEFREFKKKRENVEVLNLTTSQQQPSLPSSSSTRRDLFLRKPTHNIPDLSRCLLGHYI